MLIKSDTNGFIHPAASEITDRALYEGRRDLLKLMASGVAGAAMAGWASRQALAQGAGAVQRPGKLQALSSKPSGVAGALAMDKPTAYKDATSYNNFYEFGTDKSDPA
ncbi:MAG: protein-methionine-sulfoxide reductase catalytic subunit MsrP, partial [Rhodoferax sp.]